jgi:hypothetical protein
MSDADTDCLQVSDGLFLHPISLAGLGLKMHLNHQGRCCARNTGSDSPFTCITVVDISGIHQMNTVYCVCQPTGQGNARWQQLLRHGLSQFPYATVTTVTPEQHHEILLAFPVILSLYATQSAHMRPWTYVDTLEPRARPHPHTVTHEDT